MIWIIISSIICSSSCLTLAPSDFNFRCFSYGLLAWNEKTKRAKNGHAKWENVTVRPYQGITKWVNFLRLMQHQWTNVATLCLKTWAAAPQNLLWVSRCRQWSLWRQQDLRHLQEIDALGSGLPERFNRKSVHDIGK